MDTHKMGGIWGGIVGGKLAVLTDWLAMDLKDRGILKDQWVWFEELGEILRYWPREKRLTEIH